MNELIPSIPNYNICQQTILNQNADSETDMRGEK